MLSEHQTKKCNYPFPSQKNQKESGRNSFTILPINLQNYLPLSPFHLLASCYAKGVLSVWISPSLDSDSHLLLPLRNSMLLLLMFFHLISFQDFSYTQFQLSPILKKFSLPSISFSRNICIGVVFIPSPPPPQSMSDHFITPPLHHSTQSAAPKSPMTWILLNSMGLSMQPIGPLLPYSYFSISFASSSSPLRILKISLIYPLLHDHNFSPKH